MGDKPACEACGNWCSNCLCPMFNDAGALEFAGPLCVVAAAIRKHGTVYAVRQPARHHNVMRMMRARFGLNTGGQSNEQGFLLSDGRFASRAESLVIARANGQVDEIIGGFLTSEDLW